MTKYRIYNFNDARGRDVTVNLHIENSKILISVDTYTTSGEPNVGEIIEFTLSELKSRQEWHDGSLWSIFATDWSMTPVDIINISAETMFSRSDRGIFKNIHHFISICNIVVPFKDSNFSEMTFNVVLPTAGSKLVSNIPFEEVSSEVFGAPTVSYSPELHLEFPDEMKPDDIITGKLYAIYNEYPEKQITVELDNVNGYIPKTKFVIDGIKTAEVKVSSLGLDSGDEITVKAGFKYRRSIVSKTIKII